MKKRRVFISHGGPDSPIALRVAQELKSSDIDVSIDREKLRQGDRFLQFMNKELSICDYCLLLWSEAASNGTWVAIEWEAALYRTIQESRRFLLIGCLDQHPLPALLGPRLRVNLFPEPRPGLAELLDVIRTDEVAERESDRPVANAAKPVSQDERGVTVYVTSELFGLTQPMRINLDTPAGVHLDRLVADLALPLRFDYQGVMGVSYEYRLVHENRALERAKTLTDQRVTKGVVLWLEVSMKPFANGQPIEGELTLARFRGDDLAGIPVRAARRAFLEAVTRAGLD